MFRESYEDRYDLVSNEVIDNRNEGDIIDINENYLVLNICMLLLRKSAQTQLKLNYTLTWKNNTFW